MISELEHMYRDRYPVSIIVELTEENWVDVAEWSAADVVYGYVNRDDPTDYEKPHLVIPNGDWDPAEAYVGDHIIKTGPYWIVYNEEEWGEPGETGAVCDEYVKIGGRDAVDVASAS